MKQDAHTDRRVEKTLLALREAFFELVLTYSYDEIKVSDIIKKANVGRSTFYQHYKCKDEILAHSMNAILDNLALSVDPGDNQQTLIGMMEHFWENRKFAPRIFSGSSRRIVVQTLKVKIEKKLKSRKNKEPKVSEIPINLVAHQLAETQLVIVVDWLLGKGVCDCSSMAIHIDRSTKAICEVYFRN